MTTVPFEIYQRVNRRLEECLEIANKHFAQTLNSERQNFIKQFEMPEVVYTLTGTTAGTASTTEWKVNFNKALLLENVDHFIHQTVPHELAHLITRKIWPETQSGLRADPNSLWGFRRVKRQSHGLQWQNVMRLFGLRPDRCHQYDITKVRRRKSTSRIFCCRSCGKEYTLGLKSIQKWQRNPMGIWGRCCGRHRGTLITKEQYHNLKTGNPAQDIVNQSMIIEVPPAMPVINGTIVSKLTKCRAIYSQNPFAPRSMIINRFINEAGCTKAGANTYYHSIMKSY